MQRLWQSGIILTAASLLAGLGNYVFQGVIGRQLPLEEFGYVNTTFGFVMFLIVPVTAACQAIVHFIAHYRAIGDHGRLNGIIRGCERWLALLTAAGTAAAVLLAPPLAHFFNFPRGSLMFAALVWVAASAWLAVAGAICTGLGWFGRAAVVMVAAVALRLAAGWAGTHAWPAAEAAVYASSLPVAACLIMLLWRKEWLLSGERVSPRGRELNHFMIASTAFVFGNFAFTQSDLLVAQRHLDPAALGPYAAAGLLGRALVYLLQSLQSVLFASRSGNRHRQSPTAQQGAVIGLYILALLGAVAGVTFLRDPLIHLFFGRAEPAAAAMVGDFTLAMALVAVVQLAATWALASRWLRITVLYGVLGGLHWIAALIFGGSPDALLRTLQISAATAATILLAAILSRAFQPHPEPGRNTPPA